MSSDAAFDYAFSDKKYGMAPMMPAERDRVSTEHHDSDYYDPYNYDLD